MTTTQIAIEKLQSEITDAQSSSVMGRNTIANACKSLYNLIEQDVANAGSEWMLQGMYTDLCLGNFAEPFMANLKKTEFKNVAHIYKSRIISNL